MTVSPRRTGCSLNFEPACQPPRRRLPRWSLRGAEGTIPRPRRRRKRPSRRAKQSLCPRALNACLWKSAAPLQPTWWEGHRALTSRSGTRWQHKRTGLPTMKNFPALIAQRLGSRGADVSLRAGPMPIAPSFARNGALRRKLVLLAAILEHVAPTNEAFDRTNSSGAARAVLSLAAYGLTSAVSLLLGATVLLPAGVLCWIATRTVGSDAHARQAQ